MDYLIKKGSTTTPPAASSSNRGQLKITSNDQVYLDTGTVNKRIDFTCYYQINSIYITLDSTDPSILFPGTTWTKLEGRCLLGVATQGSTPLSSNLTGGTMELLAHSHTNYHYHVYAHYHNCSHNHQHGHSHNPGSLSVYVTCTSQTTQ